MHMGVSPGPHASFSGQASAPCPTSRSGMEASPVTRTQAKLKINLALAPARIVVNPTLHRGRRVHA
jgi:hypothetical protein